MFSLPVRVYWEDTDAGGIVFYANYLKFMERARTEWLRSRGIAQHTLKQVTGGMFIVADTQIKYLQAARLDDLLQVSARIVKCGRASIVIEQDVRLLASGDPALDPSNALICQGTICIAWVDANTLKPGRIPVSIMEALR